MQTDRRYQVFVSSTYEDLREERQQATQAILEMSCFPSGMELFPASDSTQWELIQRVISEADYYVVIVGGKYGSIGPLGLSYTEMEYDFAISKGIPVLGFVRADISEVRSRFVEADPERRNKLDAFRNKVMTRHCRPFQSPAELGLLVMKSLMSEIRVNPRVGWIRADLARTDEDRSRESDLQRDLAEANKKVSRLERKLRDRSLSLKTAAYDQLASGRDTFSFDVFFKDNDKKLVTRSIPICWDEIFETVAPSMFGYVVRKGPRKNTYGYADRGPHTYPFHDALIQLVRLKVIGEVQNRVLEIKDGQVDTCVFQLKELGYIEFEGQGEGDKKFRGITLTEAGEIQFTKLKATFRETKRAETEH